MEKLFDLFTDNQGVIRSRLPDTENFNFAQRHPVLLPSSNYFTKLWILLHLAKPATQVPSLG